jgi:anti-anti-sigma regulatory factor
VSVVSVEQDGRLTVIATAAGPNAVLVARGVLDTTTYRSLRDRIIKAALEEPNAVIIDVAELEVPAESAWAAFTSARWHVGVWPEIPIVLVCRHDAGRQAIARNGVSRYVPVYPTVEEAVDALSQRGPPPYRRRARADLPANLTSLRRSRELVAEWLSAWARADFIPVTKVVVTAFVENVLGHTDSRPNLRLETDGATVTVAVSDTSSIPAGVRDTSAAGDPPSGLRVVGALCRAWGNAPTTSGKTVWAVIGPENRL